MCPSTGKTPSNTVKAWWQIYQESAAATVERNSTVWPRNTAYPAHALDTGALIENLKFIRHKINLDALRAFQMVESAELSAICLLGLVTIYYVELKKQTPA